MPNTSDIILDTLERWGVDVVFGLPGDGINGLMEALRTRSDRIRFVLVRHEEAAAFAACGYAKFTGKLGVCLATTGPGAIHLLNGLYDAKLDSTPVLAITGVTYSDLQHSRYQQDVDTPRLMSDVAEYSAQVNSPEHARLAVDVACRTALARRGVAHLAVPVDVQEAALKDDYSQHRLPEQTSEAPVWHGVVPPPEALERAARLLNAAKRPVMLVGSGARGAAQEVVTLAERLQAPVVKALLGKDVIPDDHPLSLGGLGLLGTAPAVKAMEEADFLLMVGTSFPYSDFLPDPKKARAVQVELDPARVGLRFPVDVGLVGDSAQTLRLLLPLVEARAQGDWLPGLQGEMRDWWGLMEDRATRVDERPMKPQVVAWELGKRLRDDAIVCGDSGTNTVWAARYLKMRAGQRFTTSGSLASMASGLPYAIAAQTAFPERQVVAFVGDGGCLMLAGELSTIAHHRLPVKVFVVKNGLLGMIKWEQMVFLGNPSFGVDLPDVDFVKLAEAMGIRGFRLEEARDAGDVVQAALDHDGPALVEAVVDPNEPPHPPQVELGQALRMGKALASGEPNARRIGLTLFRDKVKDLLGGRTERDEDEVRSRRRS